MRKATVKNDPFISTMESYFLRNSGNSASLVREFYLTASCIATDTSVKGNYIPKGIQNNLGYLIIDPYTTECEVRKVTGISGTTLTVAALGYGHALNDVVIWTSDPFINAKWFGATGDGSTDDSTAINRAITQAAILGEDTTKTGYARVYLPTGHYMIDAASVVIKAFVELVGDGPMNTVLELEDSANIDVIKSDGFDTFSALETGNGNTRYSDGVPVFFGIRHLKILGNRGNNTTGHGVKFYGRHYVVENVLIYQCAGNGFYSELRTGEGPEDYWDTVEAHIVSLRIDDCNSTGFHFRGPHDTVIDSLIVSDCGRTSGDNIVFESGGAGSYSNGAYTYAGGADVKFIHSYIAGSTSNDSARGVYVNASGFKADHIIAETSHGINLHIDAQINIAVGLIRAFSSGESALALTNRPNILIECTGGVFGEIQIVDTNGTGGLQINGSANVIGSCTIDGDEASNAAVGLRILNSQNEIRVHISDFSYSGSIGLYTGYGGATNRNIIDFIIQNCDTGWDNHTAGQFNHYRGSITFDGSSQSDLINQGPNSDDSETWDVVSRDSNSGTTYFTREKIFASAVIDMTSTAHQNIAVAYSLISTPSRTDVQLTLDTGGYTGFSVDYLKVQSISGGNVDIDFKLGSTPYSGSETGNIIVWIRL